MHYTLTTYFPIARMARYQTISMVTIRPEIQEDITSIHYINQKAFGQYQEANIIDKPINGD